MVAFFGEGERRFAIVGGGDGIGAMGEENFNDVEIAVRGGFQKRGMTLGVAIVHIGAIFNEPTGDRDMIAGDGAGERSVAGAVFGHGIDVGTLGVEVARDIFVAENSGKSHYRKTIGREGGSGGGICVDDFADARKVSGGGGFMKLEMGAAGDEEIANVLAAHVAGHENGGDAVFIFRVGESRVGGEKRGSRGEVAGAYGLEEVGLTHEISREQSRNLAGWKFAKRETS